MPDTDELRAFIERLSCLDRASCSPGEGEAAELIAASLRDAGAHAQVERSWAHGTYWWPLGLTSACGIAAWWLAGRGRRAAGAALGLLGAAAAADELVAGRRPLRRALPQRVVSNVVAHTGEIGAPKKLVLVAHHDAAHTGLFFDPRITEAVGRLLERPGDGPPRQPALMAPIALAPAVAGIASIARWRSLGGLAALACAGIIVSFADMALSSTVPGANDNLTGVATLLGVARSLQRDPVEGVEVVLVSTGAEESLMEGMRAFMGRHGHELPLESTWVLCVDTVGSTHLVMPEGEGMLRMRLYDPELKDTVAACAERYGVKLRRGLRVRLGTDGYVAMRHGLAAAMIMSIEDHGAPSNYHWHTDTAGNVDYSTLEGALALAENLARAMADR
ncbi:MAG TPA: M28 family peptidase [Acidimicrobiales bacterium]|nr:M28 family peptidase [Acidimicrobiales bacterium]